VIGLRRAIAGVTVCRRGSPPQLSAHVCRNEYH